MSDDRYGRLFTEAYVEELINVATGQATNGEVLDLEACIIIAESQGVKKPFPEDEPLFLLRGQDEAVIVAIGAYSDECERLGCDPEFISKVTHTGGQILAWQVRNRDRTKRAD